jgi:hypothetical protein
MCAKLVIEHIVKKQGINLNTLVDKNFSHFSWLNEREPIKNMKGERSSKSYYYKNNKEAVRITYSKIIGIYTHQGIEYPGVYLGVKKQLHWIDWAGEIGKSKNLQPYYFNLEPVTLGDQTNTIVSFSSPKMRSIMRQERYSADDYLQSKNPNLYALIYGNYTNEYESYLRTGNKESLVNSIEAETNQQILNVFEGNIFGGEITVKDLILMNLQ